MKRIINGKLYDTEKSEKVCDLKNMFGVFNLAVYKTKNGTLFLINENACSDFFMVNEEDIKAHVGKYNPDQYIELFGEVEEA